MEYISQQYGGYLTHTNGRNVAAVYKDGLRFSKPKGNRFSVCRECEIDILVAANISLCLSQIVAVLRTVN